MKFLKYALLASTLVFASCSDDDNTPDEVNEEEVITTLTVTLDSGSDIVVLQYQDLDGEGSDPAEITVSGTLSANTVYDGSIVLLNEIEGENITEEVEEEADEHQFFYTVGSGLNVTTDYNDADSMGNPVGLSFILSTSDASSGALTFTLRHEPNKPNDGLETAGGETDIEVTFDVTVQ
ncbi:type 1 periplasmic binding fold superfamily protein [Flavobacteriaceae bacterium]|nr:type 1 periplasmic binding fold superfamily protein [Flavobacteriaceae bacterium]MDB9712757.1 type 1 periplasmic binding fold superfamily protein [Flavobacteriaceae bacterium]MDC1493046.1 type 1 periplasmic binding fold superfamily protein [Flavobacteriaceae bacterium]|tara:strand:+ start:126 stop:662 length:537 start_codon:yes stop_codon:yes gene_type:complete